MGVRRSLERARGEAPASRSKRVTRWAPTKAHICSGVAPAELAVFDSSGAFCRTSATSGSMVCDRRLVRSCL
eukprot:scaffold1516_cov125-Isochrysis_galbana.AAC.1